MPLRRCSGLRARERLPRSWSIPAGQICLANESALQHRRSFRSRYDLCRGLGDHNNIERLLDFLASRPSRCRAASIQERRQFRSLPIGDGRRSRNRRGLQTRRIQRHTVGQDAQQRPDDPRGSRPSGRRWPNWRELYTARLLQRVLRNELRRAVTARATAPRPTSRKRGTRRPAKIPTWMFSPKS